ncbi:MAG: glycosyltransferase family 39 protein [Thermodesulfobacteriota bacterium]|nr:glycosyltransferase family 39 protein [Thermodesulfobacteriota bacterium]
MWFHSQLTTFQRKYLGRVLIFVALVRLVTLGAYPLADTTEARYAEIAREMVATGNWITPQVDGGVPFWGKPPLSIWAATASFKAFGINEFGARFPSFVFALIVAWLCYLMAERQYGHEQGLLAVMLLSTQAIFFVVAGCVMTDPALVLGTTLSMVGFWRGLTETGFVGRMWGYLFFAGIAIGLLAKGPVAVVLSLFPVGVWVVWRNRWDSVWKGLPWISGSLLAIAISLPWYLLAEARTPGFLEYFLVGEHWKRFVESGWTGDLYGNAHSQPRGTIWLYWLLAAFPWSFVFVTRLLRLARHGGTSNGMSFTDDRSVYLLLWTLTPMIFFTFAGNILWTYVLPGLPAFALLMAGMVPSAVDVRMGKALESKGGGAIIPLAGWTTPLVFVLVLSLSALGLISTKKCHNHLVSRYECARTEKASQLIYLFKRPYSAQFYTGGLAKRVTTLSEAETFLDNKTQDFFAVKKSRFHKLPVTFRFRLENLGEYAGYLLLRERV